jgi:hypothetical protein
MYSPNVFSMKQTICKQNKSVNKTHETSAQKKKGGWLSLLNLGGSTLPHVFSRGGVGEE